MNGFINVLKPPGMTSHDIVGFIRYNLHMKQVGHAGTLDPGAAGVLPVAAGKSTRLIEYLSDAGKSYRAEVLLGIATDSGDDTGKVVEELKDFSMPTADEINAVLEQFNGEITQVPPAHSAIKINGQRACDLLRKGIEVEIPSRQITIYRINLLNISDNRASGGKASFTIDVDCSKGTYIRSLCADIGAKLGIPATMSFLVRTRAGDFCLEDAWTLEEIKAELERVKESGEEPAFVKNAHEYLSHIPSYQLNPAREKAFCNGLSSNDYRYGGEEGILRVYSGEKFLGIGKYEANNKNIVPMKVIS